MILHIASPKTIILEDKEVEWFHAMLCNGYPISIYPNHAPLIAKLGTNQISYRSGGKEYGVSITGGVLKVENNRITCLISDAK